MKRLLIPILSVLLLLPAFLLSMPDAQITEGLHYTRAGKAFWYSASNGGFEQYTNVPMTSLVCNNCHAATLANGTPVNNATYQPSCDDCHIEIGDKPADAVCRGCHSRQNTEFSLSKNTNPVIAERFRDVHRDQYGMGCVDCHSKDELHGDGVRYNTMFEAQHLNTTCEDCHQGSDAPLSTVPEHAKHIADVECAACHASTVMACVNCHFESEIVEKKRFYGGPPMNGFMLLVNNTYTGKVGPASFQSLTFGDQTFFGMGPFGPHTTKREGRTCSDCHDNANVRAYNQNGAIPFIQWNAATAQLEMKAPGIIPVPEDYRTALAMDYVTFLGQPSDAVTNPRNPAEWAFKKSGTDDAHMLFATPLSPTQMAALSTAIVGVETSPDLPDGFRLDGNYPNPFNPTTTLAFELPTEGRVTLEVFDAAGRSRAVLADGMTLPAGRHYMPYAAGDLTSGTYFVRLAWDGYVVTRAITLSR